SSCVRVKPKPPLRSNGNVRSREIKKTFIWYRTWFAGIAGQESQQRDNNRIERGVSRLARTPQEEAFL
ncbi:MAG TPA: hypothetical protein VIV66_03210, partial [Pyrinomonadaceae bacterium]